MMQPYYYYKIIINIIIKKIRCFYFKFEFGINSNDAAIKLV